MNPLVSQLLLVVVGGAIGALIKHLWPNSTAPVVVPPGTTPLVTPTIPATTTPTLSALLNSPILSTILQQVEAEVMGALQAQVSGIINPASPAPPAVSPKA